MNFFVRNEKFLLAIIILWVVFVSFWSFRTNPPYWFDEGIYHQVVHNLANYGKMGVQLSPTSFSDASLISVGYPVFYPAVLAFKLFGDSVAILRLTAIGFLFSFLTAVYFLARNLYGMKNAIFSVLLLSTFSPLYGNGKSFLGEVPGMFYFILGLFFLNRALSISNSKKFWYFFFGGLFCGIAASSKPNFLVILPAAAIGIVWKWRQFLSTTKGRRMSVVFFLGLLLAISYWFFTQFDKTTGAGRILSHYSNPYYIQDIWPVILSNLRRFITESTPLHFLLLLITSGLFFITKLRRRQSLEFAEIVIIVFVVAIIIFYLRTAGWYRYFFPAHLLLFVFFPVSLEYIAQHLFNFSKKYINLFLLVTVILLSATHLLVMRAERFGSERDSLSEIDFYISSLDKKESIFFYTVPYLAGRYKGDGYYQSIKMSDYLTLGSENIDLFKKGSFSYVFMEEGSVDFLIPNCYNRETSIGKIAVLKRNNEVFCFQ